MPDNTQWWNSGGIAQANNPGANNPLYATLENVKSPELDARINSLLTAFDTLHNTDRLAKFTDLYDAARSKGQDYTNEDVSNMGKYFNGEVQSALDTLRTNRRAATAGVVQRSLGDVARMLKTTQLGTGNAGTSGYLQQLGLDKAAELNSKAAMDDSDQAQKNFDFLNQMKLSLAGQRQGALNTYAQGELAPLTAQTGFYTQLAALLGQLLQQKQGNTFYGLAKNPSLN